MRELFLSAEVKRVERLWLPEEECRLTLLACMEALGPVTEPQLTEFVARLDLIAYFDMALNLAALEDQRNLFAEFAAYMNESMGAMTDLQKETKNFTEAVTKQMSAMEEMTRRSLAYANAAGKSASSAQEAAERAEEPVRRTKVDDIDELTERMDQMVLLLEKLERAQREKKKGIFR